MKIYESSWLDYLDSSLKARLEQSGMFPALSYCFYCSHYLASSLVAHPEWIEEFFVEGGYERSLDREDYRRIFTLLSYEEVRQAHLKEHVRLGVRDLVRAASIGRVLRELSYLADGVLERLLELAKKGAEEKYGISSDELSACVVALGKLGGEELNYYSDVDVMYVYRVPEELKGVSHVEIFTHLFSRLNRLLASYDDGKPIYNVDLRLRPQGRKGLLCMPVEAYEAYYESFGRVWERAMLIRARHSAGDRSVFDELMRRITPFIYRKHLDFEAIREIGRLKEMIDGESKGRDRDVKIGKGGIREIEFIVQAYQLVFGGRNPWLRTGNVFIALNRLKAAGLMGSEEYSILSQAYAFYRTLENRIQMQRCTQTHTLPADEEELKKIAVSMGYHEVGPFLKDFEDYKRRVRRIFEAFMGDVHVDDRSFIYTWGDASVRRIVEEMTEEDREKAEQMLVEVIRDAQSTGNPSMVLKNLADMVGLMKHSKQAFYELLVTRSGFRKALVEILGNSQYLSRLLISHPELMDELFEEEGRLYGSRKELLSYVEEEAKGLGLEEKLSVLRRFKLERVLGIGIAHVTGRFGIFRVFNELTKTAEVCLELLFRWLEGKRRAPFVVLAAGKLGSREMGYHSDLDLVFVSELASDDVHREFCQGLVGALTGGMGLEMLYEVDTRLRPFGSKGIMVNSPDTLREYFVKHGRVWEKLAYSRVRPVVWDNDSLKNNTMEAIREFVLAPVDGLEKEVYSMRMRMEQELGRSAYNIKYSPGGLVDIEFMAQYLAIKHGIFCPYPLSVLAKACKHGWLDGESYGILKDNYIFLRTVESLLGLVFYPPLKELPSRGEKLTTFARVMGVQEHELIDRFMEVKRSNREIFNAVLAL